MAGRYKIVRRRRIHPRTPGVIRDAIWAKVDDRIKDAVRIHSTEYNCSMSWLVDTLLADALRIKLDVKDRAFGNGRREQGRLR